MGYLAKKDASCDRTITYVEGNDVLIENVGIYIYIYFKSAHEIKKSCKPESVPSVPSGEISQSPNCLE